MATTLTIEQIYAVAREAGFTPQQAVTWTAIALAESGGNPRSLNSHGEYSLGLWQINEAADPGRATRYGNLYSPLANARAAYDLSHHGRDMRPWTTTHDANRGTEHDYRRYLPKVEALIGVQGDGRGVHDYNSPLPPPLPSSRDDPTDHNDDATAHGSAWQMPSGAGSAEQSDHDHDGLTDSFERLLGSNPDQADSDGDGISDGEEASRFHTDPLSADTDGDGVNDAVEISQGTDPGRVPGIGGVVGTGDLAANVVHAKDSDHDGLADQLEKRLGTNPHRADTDHDGINDSLEFSLGTRPDDADTDNDGITDGWEYRSGSDPLSGGAGGVEPWTMQDAAKAVDAADQPGSSGTADQQASSTDGNATALAKFIAEARAQVGDQYVYGAPLQPNKDNPTTFDCSSLTSWAAAQVGVELPRTAEEQYRFLKQEGATISVEKALHTKGALLFYFSRDPTGALPAGQAHVAISTGDGHTIEAKGTAYGVGEWSAVGRFNYAAVIPGISDPASQHQEPAATHADDNATDWAMPAGTSVDDPDSDHDGLTDAYEKLLGTDPHATDSDGDGLSDGYEATVSHTDPAAADTDHDGTPDGVEVAGHTDAGHKTLPTLATAGKDSDHDGVPDKIETMNHTDPHATDTDGDGLSDALELSLGTRGDRIDTDGDGISDYLEYRFGHDAPTGHDAVGTDH